MITVKRLYLNKDYILKVIQMDWNSEYPFFIIKYGKFTIGKEEEIMLEPNTNIKNTVGQNYSVLLYIDECCQHNVDSIR